MLISILTARTRAQAVAEMAAQKWDKSARPRSYECLRLHFCLTLYMELASVSLIQLAPKAAALGEIGHITAITLIKVIQGHQFRYQWKARMRLSISELASYLAPFPKYGGLGL